MKFTYVVMATYIHTYDDNVMIVRGNKKKKKKDSTGQGGSLPSQLFKVHHLMPLHKVLNFI